MRTGMSRGASVSAPAAKARSEDAKRPAVNPRIIRSLPNGGTKDMEDRPRRKGRTAHTVLPDGEGRRVPGDLDVPGQGGVGAGGADFEQPAPEGHVAGACR